jgi:hypothetical protein
MKYFSIWFTLLISLFLVSCGGNEIQQDAYKNAVLAYKCDLLQQKINSGDNSLTSEYNEFAQKVVTFSDEVRKKYTSDKDKRAYAAYYLAAQQEVRKNPDKYINDANYNYSTKSTEGDVVPQSETATPSNNSLDTKTMEILKKHSFVKILGLTSLIIFNFEDKNFTFRVLATDGTELSKAEGTYSISPPNGGSIANVILNRVGSIQKSPLSKDNKGIDTELFLHFNNNLQLQYPSEDLVSKAGIIPSDIAPEYYLIGRDCFYSSKILTQKEKDSIASERKHKEVKKAELEEKLKGL